MEVYMSVLNARRARVLPLLVLGLLFAGASSAMASTSAVYTQSNGADGNVVRAFERAADGSLSAAGAVSTGGLGTGAGLGSQGAVALSDNGRVLIAVNAGSDEITSFRAGENGELERIDIVPSGGDRPTYRLVGYSPGRDSTMWRSTAFFARCTLTSSGRLSRRSSNGEAPSGRIPQPTS
jgi:hypothetical protein